MIPRKKIDISFSDLAAGAAFCLRGTDVKTLEDRINVAWPSTERILPFLSVRSGFDATLTALDLPRGSEVLVSALTIRDMEKIILEHGLIPVPVDIAPQRLDIDLASLEASVSEKTKVILVAHLFGSRMRMDPIVEFARAHELLLFEDCAQAFTGPGYRGDPRCHVRMFSFGPIKTATALGGGLFYFSDSRLREKAEAIQSTWTRQSESRFLKRIFKYILISSITGRPIYGVFVVCCKWLGTDHETVIGKSVRGFAGSGFFFQIRQSPSRALLALLARRLELYDTLGIEQRGRVSQSVMDRLPDQNQLGKNAGHHSFWVFPILSDDADQLVSFLWGRGFDATRGQTSMAVVGCSGDGSRKPMSATEAYEDLLYLPVSADLSDYDAERLLVALREFSASRI